MKTTRNLGILLGLCMLLFSCKDSVRKEQDRAIELREKYPEITTAHHFNKKHWNGIDMHGSLTDKFIEELIEHSFREVIKKLPKSFVKENFPEFSLTESNRRK